MHHYTSHASCLLHVAEITLEPPLGCIGNSIVIHLISSTIFFYLLNQMPLLGQEIHLQRLKSTFLRMRLKGSLKLSARHHMLDFSGKNPNSASVNKLLCRKYSITRCATTFSKILLNETTRDMALKFPNENRYVNELPRSLILGPNLTINHLTPRRTQVSPFTEISILF